MSSRQDRVRTKVERIIEKKTRTLLTQQRQQIPFCLQKINPLLPTNPFTTQTIKQTTTLYIKTHTPANSQPAPQIPQINPSPKPQFRESKLNHIRNTTNCTSRQQTASPSIYSTNPKIPIHKLTTHEKGVSSTYHLIATTKPQARTSPLA